MMHAPVPEERPVVTNRLALTPETVNTTAAPLLDAIGPEATLKLCRQLGGTHHDRVFPLIASVIGDDLARQLSREIGRGRIVIPATPYGKPARLAAAVAFAAAGRKRQEIALELGVTVRHVYKYLAEARERDARRRA